VFLESLEDGSLSVLIVGLRHDVDNVYAVRRGLPLLVSIEEQYRVSSTIFVRTDVLPKQSYRDYMKQLESRGWEIGLHLINTTGTPSLPAPQTELSFLRKIGLNIQGVTPCGKTIGFKDDVSWKIMDALDLKYMEGYGYPSYKTKTFVMPTHLSLDIHYVRNFGEKEGYRRFKADLLQKLGKDKLATVLVHPEWFVRSVGGSGLMKIPLTLLRKQMMNRIYDVFLSEYKGKVEFKKYIDVCHLLVSNNF